ncbi:MAG TPA: hypothetical protein VNZ49_15265 [Bacteroidia bacterium]|jgi:hypothetical protein|nr:hypothetical protein [Bacteroidia bacterium]
MAIKVKNINGTADNKCKCDSWLSHWQKYSKKSAGLCAEKACRKNAEHGAHVQKDDDKSWYIVPLCTDHNLKVDELYIMDSTVFISANVSNTCGK